MTRFRELTTVMVALGSGLMAGIFFAFSSFVMTGLSLLSPTAGAQAMRAINIAAINRSFMALLFGTAVLCMVLGGSAIFRIHDAGSRLQLCGCFAYLIGTLGLTALYHVPLNDELAALPLNSPRLPYLWSRYLHQWTLWNHIRMLSSLLTSAAMVFTLRQ
jgi:uncharacterized membrane protein